VKSARALSVSDVNGDVTFCAIQFVSVEGRDCRGKRAAWVSGPEKSRHLRQHADVGPFTPGLGLEACRAVRSGREDRGIGGGEPDVGRPVGNGGGVSVSLFIAKSRADLLARPTPFVIPSPLTVPFVLVSALVGKVGLVGKAGRCSSSASVRRRFNRGTAVGADIDGRSLVWGRTSSLGSLDFLSGNVGSVAGSYSGALTLNFESFGRAFVEGAVLMLDRGNDKADIEERLDTTDDNDSCDAFLEGVAEGLLGGKLGGAALSPVGLLGGKEGLCSALSPLRAGVGGGISFFAPFE
jgi:hypothetical protein